MAQCPPVSGRKPQGRHSTEAVRPLPLAVGHPAFVKLSNFPPNRTGYDHRRQGLQDIGGVSAGAENHEDVPGLPKSLHLTGKDILKGPVVADTSQSRAVCRKGESRQGPAIAPIAPGHFFSDMHGIRRTAPVATSGNFGSGFDPLRQGPAGGRHRGDQAVTPLDGLLQGGKIVSEVHNG